jgi:hypothetical protein
LKVTVGSRPGCLSMLASVPAARLAASLPCARARGLAVPRTNMAGSTQAGRAAPAIGLGAGCRASRRRLAGSMTGST